MNQEQINIFNLITKATDPNLMVVDFEAIEKKQAERRAAVAAANPSKPVSEYEEYKQMRGRLHTLTHDANSTATYASNIAGNVDLLEKRIKVAESDKQNAFRSGNARGEASYEHQIESLKIELADAQKESKRAKKNADLCAKALKAFDGHERIAELQKHFDSINPNIY